MKRNYLMLAAATMLFAACAETDVLVDVSEKESAPQAIGFDAFAGKTTRAEITGTTGLQTDDGGFHVWGYKKRGSESEYTVFENVPVSWYAASNGVEAHWGYNNLQYWDQTSTYKFYAAAPKAPDGVTYSISDYLITIDGVSSGKSTEVVDYLIDRDGKTGVSGNLKDPVQFNFNHIMSKLSFMFKSGLADGDNRSIKITSLEMKGWNSGVGKFEQSTTSVPTTVANSEWDIEDEEKFECVIIESSNSVTINKTTATAGGYSYIMVPQTITHVEATPEVTNDDGTITPAVAESGLTFTISYYIINGNDDASENNPVDDPADEFFEDQVGILQAQQVWGTDTHTTYTIIVSPDAIEFGNPTINTWSVTDNKAQENLPL